MWRKLSELLVNGHSFFVVAKRDTEEPTMTDFCHTPKSWRVSSASSFRQSPLAPSPLKLDTDRLIGIVCVVVIVSTGWLLF